MTKPMTSSEAADYAPQWGSFITNGDPGACMYGLDAKGRPADARNRDLMVAHIDSDCLPIARERVESGKADADEMEDVERLEALKAYLMGLTFEPYTLQGEATVKGHDLREFMEHYVTAMLWSSTDESDESGGVPMDENYTSDDLTPDAWEQVESDCRDFLESVGEHITAENYIGRNTSGASVLARAGHDFWLTRNGHGAGFWDGDWRSEMKDADWNPGPMTKASKDAGELDPWIDENGKVELG